MNIDTQTKTKLREMGAPDLVKALEAQDDSACMGMTFADRLQAAVDDACSQFVTDKVAGLTKRAKLRHPEADIRKLELVEERKLNRALIAELASCGFMERCDNLVLMGFSGTGKNYFACALGKEACRQRMRTLYIRVPDLEELRRAQVEKEGSDTKLVKKLANY
jgi:DNA replication protein DnaC